MYVYKYLKKEHLEQLKEKGTLCIGNLELYRGIENYTIRDPHEGRTTYRIESGEETVELSREQVNAMTNDYSSSASLRIAPNSFFQDDLKVPNAFLFSTSCKADRELMEKWGYSSYYKIRNIEQFTKIIFNEIRKQHPLIFSVARKVSYVKTKIINVTNTNKNAVIRTIAYDESKAPQIKKIYIDDYFTKSEEFKDEEEFRFVFVPATPISKEPIYVNCKRLLSYCEF